MERESEDRPPSVEFQWHGRKPLPPEQRKILWDSLIEHILDRAEARVYAQMAAERAASGSEESDQQDAPDQPPPPSEDESTNGAG